LKRRHEESGSRRTEVQEIQKLAGNNICAECGDLDPKWCSYNLGIFICIKCSGIHRSLGVHVSFVKSLLLDDWSGEEVENMRAKGNNIANKIESDMIGEKPNKDSSEEIKRDWIIRKYTKLGVIIPDNNARERLKTNDSTNAMTEYAGILVINLIGGKNLPAADLNGTSDPYCVFKCGQQVIKSTVVEKSLSPYWGEKITLCIPSLKEPISLNVWDKDRVTDDFLGSATIIAGDLKEGETKMLIVSLEGNKKKKKEGKHSKEEKHKEGSPNNEEKHKEGSPNNEEKHKEGSHTKEEKHKEFCGTIHLELSFQSLTH